MGQVSFTLVREKLDSVVRCVGRIRSKINVDYEEFLCDADAQDIVSVNLERAIQSCVGVAAHFIAYHDLPSSGTMSDSFKILLAAKIISAENSMRMRKAVGLRNLLVHQYKAIDWRVVWEVAHHRLSDFTEFSQQIAAWMEAQSES